MLHLLNTSASYFFNYKRTLIISSQNGYINTINTVLFDIIKNVCQLTVLIVWENYLAYLIIQIACTLLANITIAQKANKLFPFLKEKDVRKLSEVTLKTIKKNTLGMACHKFSEVLVNGTDNILISYFSGIRMAGIYSNYYLLSSTVRTFYRQLFSPVTASVGSLIAEADSKKIRNYFGKMLFLNSYIAVFCSTCLFVLSNDFISLIWGQNYTLSMLTVFFIVINFYITCIRTTISVFMDAGGVFWELKLKAISEALINLVASVFLAGFCKLGLLGVIAGTTISTVTANLMWEPVVIYRFVLKESVYNFYKKFLGYVAICVLSIGLTCLLTYYIKLSIVGFAIKLAISILIPNMVFFVFFHRSEQYKFCINIIKTVLDRRKKAN